MITIKVPTFVKWAGGKKQLLSQFAEHFPKKIDRYFEPFVGGGAVALYVLQNHQPKEAYLSDINPELVNCYNVIKDSPAELIHALKEYKKEHSKEVYYKIRDQNPTELSSLQRAARFIYLNKTCFNGLYRVNSEGKFNVPMGSYTNPTVCPEQEIIEISKLLKDVKINERPFEKIADQARKGDFVYFDPPYYPLQKGKSFTTYTKDKFLEKEQEELARVFKELDKRGCKVMLSNSDTEFIRNLYKEYEPKVVKANRMINSDGKGRGKINELVIKNY